MAIERVVKPLLPNEEMEYADEEYEIEILPDGDEDFSGFEEADAEPEPEHGDNLAEFMEDEDLAELSLELMSGYEADRTSREEWEKTYVQGLDLLGQAGRFLACFVQRAIGIAQPVPSLTLVPWGVPREESRQISMLGTCKWCVCHFATRS